MHVLVAYEQFDFLCLLWHTLLETQMESLDLLRFRLSENRFVLRLSNLGIFPEDTFELYLYMISCPTKIENLSVEIYFESTFHQYILYQSQKE